MLCSSILTQKNKLVSENEVMKKELAKNRADLESKRRVIEELNKSFKELDEDRKKITESLINTKIQLAGKS